MRRLALLLFIFVATSAHAEPTDPYYCLDQWEWNSDTSMWQAPSGAISTVDLRTLPQQAHTVTPSGYGFFAFEGSCPAGAIEIGQDLDDLASASAISTLEDEFDIDLASSTVLDLLWDVLTDKADSTGQTAPKPILPNSNLSVELHLGNHSVVRSKSLRKSGAHWNNIKAVIQEDYRKILSRDGDTRARKFLGYMRYKYREPKPQDSFIPRDLPRVSPLRPETTLTESFNTSDSTTLGPDQSWTETQNDSHVKGNKAGNVTGFSQCIARVDTDLSSADHYTEAACAFPTSGIFNQVGVHARYSSSAQTYYSFEVTQTSGSATFYLVKYVAGSGTGLGTVSSPPTFVDGKILKVDISGSSLEGFYDASSLISTTDTAITGNLRSGFMVAGNANTGTTVDDWEASDGVTARNRMMITST